jgi:hypothetical protein
MLILHDWREKVRMSLLLAFCIFGFSLSQYWDNRARNIWERYAYEQRKRYSNHLGEVEPSYVSRYTPVTYQHHGDYWYVLRVLFGLIWRRHPETTRSDPFEDSVKPGKQSNNIREFGYTFSDGLFQDYPFLDWRKRSTTDDVTSYAYASPFYGGPIVTYWNTPYGSGYSTDYSSESGTSNSYVDVNGNSMSLHPCIVIHLLAIGRTTTYGASTSTPPCMFCWVSWFSLWYSRVIDYVLWQQEEKMIGNLTLLVYGYFAWISIAISDNTLYFFMIISE